MGAAERLIIVSKNVMNLCLPCVIYPWNRVALAAIQYCNRPDADKGSPVEDSDDERTCAADRVAS